MTSEYRVYKHTSPSGKVYIGVTKNKPNTRWRNGRGYKANEYFCKAICKYGWGNFQHEILAEGLSYEDAASMEIDLIAIHKATNRDYGYNIEHGGNMCGTHSEETKRKMSIAISKAMTGKKASHETRLAMSKAHKAKPMTESRKKQLTDCRIKRPVEQLDLNGNVIARFSRLIDAANSVNASRGNICSVCRGINLTCKGYKWRYCDEGSA